MENLFLDKTRTRDFFRKLRKQISSAYKTSAAHKAKTLLVGSHLFAESNDIAIYLPFNHEFPTEELIQAIWQAKKKCYLPRVSETSRELTFCQYLQQDSLIVNRYGIAEPKKDAKQKPVTDLDLVILPLVAFDENRQRIGNGGGHYDFTFAFKHSQSLNKPVLLGLAFDMQGVKTLPKEAWDVDLDGILTEETLLIF